MIDVLSAFGLSSAAGLNAYLPLLIVGLAARYTDLITLNSPWDTLENPWVLAALAVLLLIEMTVDKIPGVDTLNDAIQTFIRPAAGAILFASGSGAVGHVHPAVALVLGLLVAGTVHAAKATARPAITATTLGIANPVVSLAEDVVSAGTAIVAIAFPLVAAVGVVVALTLFLFWLSRRRARRLESTDRRYSDLPESSKLSGR